jgi:hypothetical protein
MFNTILVTSTHKEKDVNADIENVLHELSRGLQSMSIASTINTLDFLHTLIAIQLTAQPDKNLKIWVDLLVQRFEVTKKVYELYSSGFRKGEGLNNRVKLYWLFALVLCLYYTRSKGLKYLNTLLKVCDLLCSLQEDMVCKELPVTGLALVLATEVTSIFLLAEKKGIQIAPN